MQIQFIYRKPTSGQFSIERVFKPIEQYLKETNKVSSVFLPNFSSGLSNIWKNINSLKSNEFDLKGFRGNEASKARVMIKRGSKALQNALEKGIESSQNQFNTK